ncbi:MAG: aminotransferase class III-fold pyridoxal phosphate-dependent enzyme, partial [Actinobacteria bacterium]|nr:aminotransferase class III-fold pyridoxal phosphate-dependent enzyme [Actinomycetota bacterium]
LLSDVKFIEPNNLTALAEVVTNETAALWLEPILGEGGVIPLTNEYLQLAREICNQTGTLLVIDEVQTGIARTGTFFAYQQAQIRPDLLLLAKGLGGGLPIGAVLGFGKAGDLLQPGMHGSTFGGNPISCSAANAVLDVIESENLVTRTLEIEDQVRAQLDSCPGVKNIRGHGAMLGVELVDDIGPHVVSDALKSGLITNSALLNLIRLVPPLTITHEELTEGLAILKSSILNLARGN